ncbi:DUF5995 family protein [Actinoplanes sp. NPDC023714]|uniref:DUF5995 family protein n=1 Tax=Actinoplanes sp. NPDC023714 TaxID=3154322 RepID=UPI0033FC718A
MNFDREKVEASADRLRECRKRIQKDVEVINGWTPSEQAMADACRVPPEDIAGVVARLKVLQEILDEMPPSPRAHRVAAFNSLYLTITQRVERHLQGKDVVDKNWLEVLDVEFARLYFRALSTWGVPDVDTPDAWEVLFRRAQDQRMSTLEAAVLGVNAHINRDLSLALIATWKRLGYTGDGPQHPDYLLVNKIFYEEIPPLRRRFANAWQMEIDRCVGELDDWSQRVLVRTTRARAWEQAERLWELQDDKEDFDRAVLVQDRIAAVAGETLLHGASIVRVLWLTMRAAAANLWHTVRGNRSPKELEAAGKK